MVAAVIIATLFSATVSAAFMWGGHYAYLQDRLTRIGAYTYGVSFIIGPATLASITLGYLVHSDELPQGYGFYIAPLIYVITTLAAGATVKACYLYDNFKTERINERIRAREAHNNAYVFTRDNQQAGED